MKFSYQYAHSENNWDMGADLNRAIILALETPNTYFCLCAICARTCASTLVGSWIASFPRTLIKLEILTTISKVTQIPGVNSMALTPNKIIINYFNHFELADDMHVAYNPSLNKHFSHTCRGFQ